MMQGSTADGNECIKKDVRGGGPDGKKKAIRVKAAAWYGRAARWSA